MFKVAIHAIPVLFDQGGHLPQPVREIIHELAEYCQFHLMVDDDYDVRRVESYAENLVRPGNFRVTVADNDDRVKIALALGCEVIVDDNLKVIGRALASNITPIRWVTPLNAISYGLHAASWREIKTHVLELSNDSQPDTNSRRGWIQVRGRPTAPPAI